MLLKERFESRVHLIPFTTCHIWDQDATGGYGKIRVMGRTLSAHRVAYELYVGEIPDGLCILHSCDNRACVNPAHLRVGTHRENTEDMRSRGRGLNGEAVVNSKLTASNVKDIKRIYPSKTQAEIGRMFGVSQSLISLIVLGKNWRHFDSLNL